MLKWLVRFFALSFMIITFSSAVGLYYLWEFVKETPSLDHEEKIVYIPKGSSVSTISNILKQNGIITDPLKFRYYIKFKGLSSNLRAGEFRFYSDMTPDDVLDVLISGEEVTYKVTFPEGYNMKDMSKAIKVIPFLNGEVFLELAKDKMSAEKFDIDAPNLEGFLFPATYELRRGQKELDLIAMMVKEFKRHWTKNWSARAEELSMTQIEVITLASIVEKETGDPEERSLVSSVFHNRLKKKMKLESDPTIIYGLPNYDGDIHKSDIRYPHPWNTYVIPGLPPSPIANPGSSAIVATLYPEKTKFLYFVAKGDGAHTFSVTFAEHSEKVQEYQVRRKRRSDKSEQKE